MVVDWYRDGDYAGFVRGARRRKELLGIGTDYGGLSLMPKRKGKHDVWDERVFVKGQMERRDQSISESLRLARKAVVICLLAFRTKVRVVLQPVTIGTPVRAGKFAPLVQQPEHGS